MSSHDATAPDDLDGLLSPAATSADGELRQAILRQTTRIVRRRRHVRRVVLAAAMLVCYAAGATTMQLWNRPTPGVSQPLAERQPPRPSRATVVASSPATPAPHSPPVQPPSPPPSSYERLRRYSDRLLEQQGDIALAARYYARALEKASAEERAISVEDSWLLMALKADRLQENSHENRGS